MNELLFEKVKQAIKESDPYPGYPATRLTLAESELTDMTEINLPDGPWEMNGTEPPSPEETASFVAAGYSVDAKGRPLHPALRSMVTDPEVGVITGRGRYWNWGPNFTADPIIMTRSACPRVLLIKRGDTGSWALPGGFIDPTDEDDAAAARREAREEAGIDGLNEPLEVYRGVVGDKRATAHAWPETAAYLFQLDRQVPVTGGDDATDAKWVRLDRLSEVLFGSHQFLIEEALTHAQYEQKTPIMEILARPRESLEVEIIDAGHMAYDHLFVRDGDTRLFIKEHVPERFTDSFREAHSRAYLEKELDEYEHVAEHGYSFIPDRVDLVDDRLLAMDALHESDGWLWRAPENAQFGRYVSDVLTALEQLALVPVKKDPEYHTAINPTYETFWAEGWDDIGDEKVEPLVDKIRQLSADWTEEQKAWAQQLIDALPDLQQRASKIDRQVEFVTAHNDARQSNIAWHPDAGARLVDWSWGDPAPRGADTTMFLVDLAKSDFDISPYTEKVDRDQLIVLIGFWLAHSLWQTRDGSMTVREQQVASATAAFRVLRQLEPTTETMAK